ncbi:hypothetical protein TNCV_46901 [Trichonephila clavipes]|nr:hypothetical protein TNCV_46901 [Trichonephila clavipes]
MPFGSTVSLSEHEQIHSAGKMLNQQKFVMKFKKSDTKTFQLPTEAYGDKILPGAHAFEWYNRFSGGRVSGEEDEPAGRPSGRGSGKNRISPTGTSKTLVPKLLPGMAVRNPEMCEC